MDTEPDFEPCTAVAQWSERLCLRTASLPPCLKTAGDFGALCSVCAAAGAGGKCCSCGGRFNAAAQGLDVYTLDCGPLEGAPLCLACSAEIGNSLVEHDTAHHALRAAMLCCAAVLRASADQLKLTADDLEGASGEKMLREGHALTATSVAALRSFVAATSGTTRELAMLVLRRHFRAPANRPGGK